VSPRKRSSHLDRTADGHDEADERRATRGRDGDLSKFARRGWVECSRPGQEFARPRERYRSIISCKMMGFANAQLIRSGQACAFRRKIGCPARGPRDAIEPKPSRPCNELQSAKLIRVGNRESEERHV